MVALAYVALVVLGVTAAAGHGAGTAPVVGTVTGTERSGPRWAVALWLTVAVPSLLQPVVPALLDAAERDPDRVAHGQVWRLVTSAVTQDGGLSGTTFNLAVLAAVAATAWRVLGGRGLWAAFWIGASTCNLLVLLVWPSVGAGNSMATFTVAVTVVAVVARTSRTTAATAREVVALALGALLLGVHDQHGFAVVVGTGLGLLWPRPAASPPAG